MHAYVRLNMAELAAENWHSLENAKIRQNQR